MQLLDRIEKLDREKLDRVNVDMTKEIAASLSK